MTNFEFEVQGKLFTEISEKIEEYSRRYPELGTISFLVVQADLLVMEFVLDGRSKEAFLDIMSTSFEKMKSHMEN